MILCEEKAIEADELRNESATSLVELNESARDANERCERLTQAEEI